MSSTFVKRAAFFVAGAMVVSAASAYVLLNPIRSWDAPPTIIVDNQGNSTITDGDGGLSRTIAAITSNSAWNGAGSGTLLAAVPGSTASWTLGDGTPMLSFKDPARGCKGTCLAATYTGYATARGDGTYAYYDSDIVTNTRQPFTTLGEPDGCSGEFYMEGVMVHEIGHLLGLGHTNVSGATMYPSVSYCNNGPATIENDDRNGINALY